MNTLTQRAALQLEREILAGRYPTGAKLPPEAELAEILGVSRGTLRAAVGELQARGYVSREQGRGTYVARTGSVNVRIELDLNDSVTSNIRGGGYSPGTTGLAVTSVAELPGLFERLAPHERSLDAIEVRRTRTADGTPITHSVDYVVRTPGTSLSVASDFSGSLYELLRKVHGKDVSVGYAKIEAGVADSEIASQLAVEPGHLLLVIKQVHMLGDGKPVMYSAVYHRNDAVDIHVARVKSVDSSEE